MAERAAGAGDAGRGVAPRGGAVGAGGRGAGPTKYVNAATLEALPAASSAMACSVASASIAIGPT